MTNINNSGESSKPAIIVHGGAWSIPDSLKEDHISGVISAVKLGYKCLVDGKSALEAVEEAVVCMEDNPIYDAGVGSFLNEEGYVELDALIMDSTMEAGAIGAVSNCKNPIKLARKLLGKTYSPMMVVGRGADHFAEKMDLSCDPKELIIPREKRRWEKQRQEGIDIFKPSAQGTVGAVAVDMKGNLASGTSTGGSPLKMEGRLGDTPLIGSGGYACEIAAASSTGHGESFMKLNAAKLATDLCENQDPQISARMVIDKIANIGGHGGIIIVNRSGKIGYYFNTERMAYALITERELSYGIDPK